MNASANVKKTRTRARTVTTDAGRIYPLVIQTVTGEKACPGEAHSNPYIDNCMTCAPRWGVVPTYAPLDLIEATGAGFAVPCSLVEREEQDRAQALDRVDLVHVVEKSRGGGSCSFYAYVKREVST